MSRLPLSVLAWLLALTLDPAVGAINNHPDAVRAVPQPSTELVKKNVTKVIEDQLAAFRADDYPKAFAFASAEIRQALDVTQFEEMVRTGYPVIAKSAKAEFGLIFDVGEEAVVNVRVSNGPKAIDYQYHIVKQKDGWRIGGVTELKKDGVTV